jgi:hypothetical protein
MNASSLASVRFCIAATSRISFPRFNLQPVDLKHRITDDLYVLIMFVQPFLQQSPLTLK